MATERFDIVVRARGTNQVNRKIKSIGTRANSTRKLLALMRAALVIIASIEVIRGFTRLIDVFTEMRNRLRLLTDDTRVLATIQNSLFKIAQETRASFETLGDVFFKTARSTLRLRLDFKELLDITKVLAQTIAISGVATESANAALIQFGQGLASGALAGEELRSVSENLPELARIIGKEFGIAGGQLIAFNKANKNIFTTERLVKALKDAIPELGDIFNTTQVTISQGFTRVGNALIFFLGGVNDAIGVSEFLAKGLTNIADNIDKVVVGLIALTGLVVFNFLIGQVFTLIGLMRTLATVVGVVVVRAFLVLIQPIKTLITLFSLLSVAIFTNPLFLIGAAVILAMVGAFFLFRDEITKTITSLGGLTGIFNKFVAFFGSGIIVMIENWELLGQVIKETFIGALNFVIAAFERTLNFISKGITDLVNAVSSLISIGVLGEAQLIQFPDLVFDFGRITSEAEGSLSDLVKLFKNKFKEIEDSNPAATIEERFNMFLDFLKKFTKDGAVVLDELLKLFPKGAGEGKELTAELNKELNAIGALVRGLSPLAEMRARMIRINNALTKARGAGIDVLKVFGLTEDEIIRRSIRNQLGAGNATAILAEKTKLLNEARKAGNITAVEEIRLLRDARIAALQLDESFSGQLTLTLLEFQKELTNLGELAGNTVVNAFGSAEDAIVKFVTTGKLEFSSLIDSILTDLTRLAVRQAITAPLANLLGIGDPGGGFLGDLLGAFTGGSTGGGGGAGPSIPGLRTGGQFTVGGAGGADSQLIAFKATPGEEVTVTRPDQRPTGTEGISGRPIQVIFQIETPSVDSFRRSQDQLMNEAFIAATRANRRNS